MKKILIIAALLATGCGTSRAPSELPAPDRTEAPATSSGGRDTAWNAAKGAGKGAVACAMPALVGGYVAGPIGFLAGGYLSLFCLPVGIVAGAVIGATGTSAAPAGN
jgi:hypothetical protein